MTRSTFEAELGEIPARVAAGTAWKPFVVSTNQIIDETMETPDDWQRVVEHYEDTYHWEPDELVQRLQVSPGSVEEYGIPYVSFRPYDDGQPLNEWAEENGIELLESV